MLETEQGIEKVSEKIGGVIAAVMVERGLEVTNIEPSANLSDTLGLTSMDLAQIVLTLEDELGIDAFKEIPITSIKTVLDLVRAYAVALGLTDKEAHGGQDMVAEMTLAKSRRRPRRR
jgi:acyl carrier protein